MTKNNAVANRVQTTADKAEELGKFTAIADASRAAGKRVKSAESRLGTLVDEIAPTVALAYSTGYVHTERTSKDNPLPLGAVRQNDYAKMFGHDSPNMVARWRLYGMAQNAGLKVTDPLYKALKVSNLASAAPVAAAILAKGATPESIAKAVESYKADKAKAIEASKSGTESDEGDTRAAQVAVKATQSQIVSALVAAVGALDLAECTPDEHAKISDVLKVLTDKVSKNDKAHGTTTPVKVVKPKSA